ncbi:unnamed protein product [Cryptosporidium hominis]|uniref:Uncharacterized protein n=2 Tax=Cryptosporidium hominis TaxID=237895 RepID=A0A0S4TAY9_CRYHO|nr:hypothetical protein [Cryptosporidium hominis TU502]OLQ17111.1 putative signal peptide protein [Cryptosporidium hominis]PPA65120.1 hypothetical protein ChUKH1_15545 [Cryptosporidium hominis]PPS93567.1 Uncharacterized protein GY17_00003646 [Cryptosporidium hominis]CUV04361.1 unnamed protein product [Cryptosporidium hominis]|eukprot:PPS93567.1 Uncharacterized protein GY17_00003646 [Cryptosporidium hominis]
MKFLYVFLCLICLLNYTTFNQLGRVDEYSKISLIKVKSLNLSSSDFPNGEENHESTGDRQDETDGNGSSSSSSSSNDPEEDEADGSSSFGGAPLSSPRPQRRKLWGRGHKGNSPHPDSEGDEADGLGSFGGAPLSSPRPSRRKLWGRGNRGGHSHSDPESDGESTGPFGGLAPRPPSPLKTIPRKTKLRKRF